MRHGLGRVRALLAGVALTGALLGAQTVAAAPPASQPVFPYGVSWYPELWPEDSWGSDLAAMKRANISFVRMAEFSWSRLEPEEGRFEFGWLDHAIAQAKAAGMKVVLGTPTAAPPAWLTTRYPDTLLVEADGQRARHGGRRHFSVASGTYRAKAAGIAARLAERYGHDPDVLGFQIDNEYGRDTFDPEMRSRFQTWLRAKYGTLAALNRAWYTGNWSVSYSDWAQVDLPRPFDFPGHVVDGKRFKSDMWRDYQQAQIDAMRPHLSPDKFITHNYVSKYSEFDFSVPARRLDLVSWDFYSEGERLDPPEGALMSGLYRGFLNRNPWVMESSAGNIVFVDRNFTQQRGEVRAMAWQSIAHGADGYAYWVWKSPLGGNEQFHGSMVDAGGRDRPVFAEIAQAGAEIKRAWPVLRGSNPVAEVAFLHDYPSRWALERLPMTRDYDPWKVQVDLYRAVAPAVGGIDVLGTPESLARYRLVVAPTMHMISAGAARALDSYVRAGGHLLVGPRAGVKDEFNLLWQPGAPGPLGALIGARVDHTQVLDRPLALAGALGEAKANVWAERLTATAPGLETLLSYAPRDGFLDGQPAVVSRRVGKGRITYVGAWLDAPSLARVAAWAAQQAGAKPLIAGVPGGVEIAAREGPLGRTTVAINWTDADQSFALPAPMRDIVDGTTKARVTLPKHGVAVLVR
ncbi:beta-galactosidase [Sandaracinobacteroides saxicola]|uniref:Beta-galactosidase n=1 Tax=Sandaracinobacteroides saxicola TaxID=2759707 RepID=A0A7G5IFA9_9SPHN|nr:beta-galactosidase [Sandaracinobacteroides saxicola]QMW22051.1 beta-galactosidase [Sandaracinobacteroides saxicola]